MTRQETIDERELREYGEEHRRLLDMSQLENERKMILRGVNPMFIYGTREYFEEEARSRNADCEYIVKKYRSTLDPDQW